MTVTTSLRTAALLAEAVRHPGFSFVEVLSPCVTFRPDQRSWKERAHPALHHRPRLHRHAPHRPRQPPRELVEEHLERRIERFVEEVGVVDEMLQVDALIVAARYRGESDDPAAAED
jgi:pyruvate/2-oxoacid:ferredoxin oxidoreductase beta subunit